MRSKLFVLLLQGLFITKPASAALTKYSVKPQDSIQLTLAKAQITLSGTTENAVSINASGVCPPLIADVRDGNLSLKEQDPLKLHSETANCQMQIALPTQSFRLHLLEGGIIAQKVNMNALLHLQKGKVTLRDCSGSVQVHMEKGDLQINSFQGRVRLDLMSANANLKEVVGDIDLQSLGGEFVFEKAHGNLRITQVQGNSKVLGGQGALQIDSVRSNLVTQAFQGRIEGQTQEGTLSIWLAPEPDVNIRSKAGKIRLTASPQSGASVNLNMASPDGELLGPSVLKAAHEGSARSLRGRLSGEGKGSLIVRAQEGSLVLK